MNKVPDTTPEMIIKSGLMQVPAYPLHLAKVLIQIGHEPLPPFKSKSLLGKEVYYYPNLFKYLKYIYSVEGVVGLYRGVGMRMASHMAGTAVYNRALKCFDDNNCCVITKTKDTSDDEELDRYIKATQRDVLARCWAVVLSQPFHVMGLRCMAQFIGGEDNYSSWNIIQNANEIFKSEGLGGFFSGLVPRLLFEASTIVLTNSAVYIVKSYILSDKDFDAITEVMASLLASSVTYPLSLVSTVSSISGSRIAAARPPKMPLYPSWLDVLRHLKDTNQLKRGASMFFRAYAPVLANAHALSSGYRLA